MAANRICWRIILANLAASVFNIFVMLSVPFGVWRAFEPHEFLAILLAANAVIWFGTFAYVAPRREAA